MRMDMHRYRQAYTDDLFNEMLYQVKLLITHQGGTSEEQIKKQFRNIKSSVVETFLTEAIKRGILKIDKCTYFVAVESTVLTH